MKTNNKLIKGDTLKFSIMVTDGIVRIYLASNNIIEKDLFTAIRSRVPNREVTYTFLYSKIKSRTIKRCLNKLPVNQSLFWRFANSRLQKFRGTTVNNLYLFLKELEFRYNNRNEVLFDQLINGIASFKFEK
jgi:transposase-like protein